MDRFIGLDVHQQTCTVAVLSETGKRVRETVVATNGPELLGAIRGLNGRLHLAFEEGTQSEWLYELLDPHVADLRVVASRWRAGNKSDALDAWGLAEQLRLGARATCVYKAPRSFAPLRYAMRAHRVLVQDVVRVKNRLKAVFRSRGITAGDDVYDADRRAAPLAKLPPGPQLLAKLLAAELDVLEPLRQAAEKQLLEEAKRHAAVKLLETVPGIGAIRAAQIVAIVVTPHRFRTSRQFWSYCGLGIVTRSSADWVPDERGSWKRGAVVQTCGLNRNRQPLLKSIFKGAAKTAEQDPRSALHDDFHKLLENTKPNLARLTMARRIAAVALAIWKRKEPYDPARRHAQGTTT